MRGVILLITKLACVLAGALGVTVFARWHVSAPSRCMCTGHYLLYNHAAAYGYCEAIAQLCFRHKHSPSMSYDHTSITHKDDCRLDCENLYILGNFAGVYSLKGIQAISCHT